MHHLTRSNNQLRSHCLYALKQSKRPDTTSRDELHAMTIDPSA